MRTRLLALVVVTAISSGSYAAIQRPVKEPSPAEVFLAINGSGAKISLYEFLQLSPKAFQQRTGRRLSLAEKISFRVTQARYRKCIRKDGSVNMQRFNTIAAKAYRFNFGGFALGFVLWIPGVIIALLVDNKNKSKDVFLSALIGCLVSPFTFVLLLALMFAPK